MRNKNTPSLIVSQTFRYLGLVGCALLLSACGCEAFRQSPTAYQPPSLPVNRLASDAVGLEIGITQIDTSQADTIKRFWRDLDQQELSLETRQRLDKHGLKAAVMSQRPPSDFGDLVNPREVVLEELDGFQRQLYLRGKLKATDRMVSRNQVSTRQGQSHLIPVSVVHPSLSWTFETPAPLDEPAFDNQAIITTGSADHVRGVISVRTYPHGDGSVGVFVQPQIHHGAVTQRYGATSSGFKFDQQQTIVVLEPLEFDVLLRTGETLVIGPTAQVTQLGHLFFGEIDSSQDDSLASAADQLLAQATSEADSKSTSDVDQDRLPELNIDESKFDSIVGKLDINDISQSLTEAFGGGLEPAAREKPQPFHRLLMIRVVQTQLDDLFDRQQVEQEPLSTSDEF